MIISIVIPTLNEEGSIGQVIDEINGVMIESKVQYEILVVDGLSKDRTREIAGSKGATVIKEPRKGYGRAYKTGFEHAKGDIIATMDGDFTYPASDIVMLVNILNKEDLDFLSADRMVHMEEGAMSTMHKIGNLTLSFTTRLLFGRIIHDSQSGMWVLRKSILPRLRVMEDGMAFSEEIKIEAFVKLRKRAKEIPIHYRRRIGEVKLNSWEDGYRNMRFLVAKRFVIRSSD